MTQTQSWNKASLIGICNFLLVSSIPARESLRQTSGHNQSCIVINSAATQIKFLVQDRTLLHPDDGSPSHVYAYANWQPIAWFRRLSANCQSVDSTRALHSRNRVVSSKSKPPGGSRAGGAQSRSLSRSEFAAAEPRSRAIPFGFGERTESENKLSRDKSGIGETVRLMTYAYWAERLPPKCSGWCLECGSWSDRLEPGVLRGSPPRTPR